MNNPTTGNPMELREVEAVTVFMGKTISYQQVHFYVPDTGEILMTQEQGEENHRRMEHAVSGLQEGEGDDTTGASAQPQAAAEDTQPADDGGKDA